MNNSVNNTEKEIFNGKYYIVVKLHFAGELYSVFGPYDSFEEAENDFDIQYLMWSNSL